MAALNMERPVVILPIELASRQPFSSGWLCPTSSAQFRLHRRSRCSHFPSLIKSRFIKRNNSHHPHNSIHSPICNQLFGIVALWLSSASHQQDSDHRSCPTAVDEAPSAPPRPSLKPRDNEPRITTTAKPPCVALKTHHRCERGREIKYTWAGCGVMVESNNNRHLRMLYQHVWPRLEERQ